MKLSFKLVISSLSLLFASQVGLAQCPSDSPSSSGFVPEQIAWNPPGNQDCQEYSFFRLEDITSGTYSLPAGGSVSITVTNTSCGPVFSVDAISANLISISVKGGPDSVNVYDYSSPIVSDGDLHSVHNPNSGQWYGLSHIDFCYEPCECLLTCPADITLDCTESTDPSNTGTATSSGACGAIEYSDVTVQGPCDGDYTIERTWTSVNQCNNVTESCLQLIHIEDNNNPEISCPADVTVSCGASTEPLATGTATATDACSNVTVTYSDATSGNSCQTDVVRTWTATDDCGNTDMCTQTIQLIDDTDPEISCPADVTVSCGASTEPLATGTATATDACSNVTVTYSDATSGNSCQTDIVRTWTATDDCGNTDMCTQTIQLIDDADPEISCPADVTVSCGASTDPSTTGTATATDACSNVTVTYSDATSGNICQTDINRTWTASDDCGNTSTCNQLISIVDDLPPVINCPADIDVDCDQSTDPSVTGTATATDDCSTVTVSYSDGSTTAPCDQGGGVLRTWTATDACGNTTECEQTISIVDNTPPVITCPDDISVECNDGVDPLTCGNPVATDDCSGVNVSFNDLQQGSGCDFSIIRTWTAEDNCGNESTCTQMLEVVDESAPEISCPVDVNASCGGDTDPLTTGEASATDNCSSVTVSYSDDTNGSGCDLELTRTWTATDECGNVSDCIQTIALSDDTSPEIECPADVSVACGSAYDVSVTGEATATDNCSTIEGITYVDNNTGDLCDSEGGLERIWTASDACGNTATCVQIISLSDDEAPEIECPSDVSISCGDDDCPSQLGEPTATDNCDENLLIYHQDVSSGNPCSADGGIQRTWTATDDCGNASSCVQVITVVDDVAPVFDEDWTPGCDMVITATDNCDDEVEITCSNGPVVEANCTKTQELTYIATDDCGNTAERTITLSWIVEFDNVPPVLECPADITLEEGTSAHPDETGWASSEAGAVVTYRDELSSCGGEISRIWTARDACGNESTCTQILECSCTDGNLNEQKEDVQEVAYQSLSAQEGLNGAKAKLFAYPNPSVNTIYFELGIPYESDVLLEIYDLKGQLIKSIFDGQMAKGTKHVSYQLDQLKAGTYMVKLTTNEEVLSQQVIKQ